MEKKENYWTIPPSLSNKGAHNVDGGFRDVSFVKLHSKLINPTELQLDGVGVDFVFPPSQQLSK